MSINKSIAAATAAVMLLAGCGESSSNEPLKPAAAPPASTDFTAYESIPAKTAASSEVRWARCKEKELKGLQCATVSVPLDHDAPGGDQIKLAISRLKHTVKNGYKGIVLTNPGGPGLPGRSLVTSATNFAPKNAGRYDWIGIDVRGVGASTPQVKCKASKQASKLPAKPVSQADVDRQRKAAEAYAKSCSSGPGAALVPHMRTIDIARDLDQIRAQLGADKAGYWGNSYGTYLGQVFASQFPEQVRWLLLDSVVDPRSNWFESNKAQNVSMTQAFAVFLRWMAKNDKKLKLGDDPQRIGARFFKAVDRLAAIDRKRGTSYAKAALSAASNAAYGVSGWPAGSSTIKMLLQKKPDLRVLESGGQGQADSARPAYLSVNCSESPWPEFAKQVAVAREQAAKNPLATWTNTWMNAPCAFWPAYSSAPPAIDGGAVQAPLLLLNEEFDGATPFAGALATREVFPSARLVIGRGGSTHSAIVGGGDPCLSQLIEAMIGTGRVPARAGAGKPDASCPAAKPPKL